MPAKACTLCWAPGLAGDLEEVHIQLLHHYNHTSRQGRLHFAAINSKH